jgi:hypothetical protein
VQTEQKTSNRISMLRALTALAAVATQPRAWKSGATINPIKHNLTRCAPSQRPLSLERAIEHLAMVGLLTLPSPLNHMRTRLTKSGRLLAGMVGAACPISNRWFPHPRYLMRIVPVQRRHLRWTYQLMTKNAGEFAHALNQGPPPEQESAEIKPGMARARPQHGHCPTC